MTVASNASSFHYVTTGSALSEDSELILKDIFSFCKLIAFLAAR